jgi:hypothetical protein
MPAYWLERKDFDTEEEWNKHEQALSAQAEEEGERMFEEEKERQYRYNTRISKKRTWPGKFRRACHTNRQPSRDSLEFAP